jgi:GNAT superfamily N-acetyltransferase
VTMRDPKEGSRAKRALKTAARALIGPYRFNRIYRSGSTDLEPVQPHGVSIQRLEDPPPASIPDPELRGRLWYGGHDASGYGLFLDGHLAATCWFWGPRRFNDSLLWVVKEDEAMLIDVVTASSHRGRGLAALLIRGASAEMRRIGRNPLYAFIWHSHHASYHAFEKAGWSQIAWVLEIRPFGMPRRFRFCWRTRSNRRHGDAVHLRQVGAGQGCSDRGRHTPDTQLCAGQVPPNEPSQS